MSTILSMEKRKKSKELSEDLRQYCGKAWTISRLQVHLQRSWCSCVHCAQHQEFYSPWHCTVLPLDVDGRQQLMKDCNEGLFEWWIKNLDQLPNKFKLTSRQRLQQWMKWNAMVGDPGGPHCWAIVQVWAIRPFQCFLPGPNVRGQGISWELRNQREQR